MSSDYSIQSDSTITQPFDARARVAIDLGAESCRVSLLRWIDGRPAIELLHRIPNGPVHRDGDLVWPLDEIIAGLDDGLRKAAAAAPEGIASIAVDGWAVDYVRLNPAGRPVAPPFCYRDERTLQSKLEADKIADPESVFSQTGAQPLRINTLYQLLADSPAVQNSPWLSLPEYVLFRLGARAVAEYTIATHTGLVDLKTGDWCQPLLDRFNLPREAFPPIVQSGTVVGKLQGPLAKLDALRDTDLIVPACHDTASAVAGICTDLTDTAYLCSGTWSLIGTVIDRPVTSSEALRSGFTNLGAAGGGFCFHTLVNGMWLLKQCLNTWASAGRSWPLAELILQAERSNAAPGTIPVSAPSLLLDGDMPARLNEQLRLAGLEEIPNTAGNEPLFARLIFESLAQEYGSIVQNLEHILNHRFQDHGLKDHGFKDHRFKRIHILGGGSLNQMLTRLTAQTTGLAVERGHVESSTIGNFAVQLASAEACGRTATKKSIQRWASSLCEQASAPVLT